MALAHVITFPVLSTRPSLRVAAPYEPSPDRTAMRVVRKQEKPLTWEQIQREVRAQDDERMAEQVKRAVAQCGKAKRCRSGAPWLRMTDTWGMAALVDREHERACRISPLPSSLEALLATPEWKGATLVDTGAAWEVRHPSGAVIRKKK